MVIKTKKYKLETSKYIKMAMVSLLRRQWWYIFGPILIACLAFIWPSWWFVSIAILIVVLYLLFWAVQFAGVTQMEQNKVMFEKLSYEIDGRQILMKLNERQGMPLGWDMIKNADKDKEAFTLFLSKVQFIHLPFRIFNHPNDIKLMDSLLRRKNLLAASPVNQKPAA
ncbi:hypothetical protein BH24BAC1_BH24BAC1_37720 [soil metagenome]